MVSTSGPNFAIRTVKMDAHELISANSFYETLNKRKLFSIISRNILPYVWWTIAIELFAKWPEKYKYMLETEFFCFILGQNKGGGAGALP